MTFVATFPVFGIPKAQPRVRAFARKMGDKYVARVYDAGTAEAWKSLVVEAARPHRPETPLEGPLLVAITFYLKRPKRLCRKKDPNGALPAISKPDIDNTVKAVLDALTQDGWWRDDAQVCELRATKLYHAKDGVPGAHIVIKETSKELME